jgi:hypothetical protein
MIIFTGCTAAEQEQESNLTSVSPVVSNFETTIDDDVATGYSVGTVELVAGDVNITSFTIFSGIEDDNNTKIDNPNINDFKKYKDNILPVDAFQIEDNGEIRVKAASLIDYVKQTTYDFYVVATNEFGSSNVQTIIINVKKSGRIELLGASYGNRGSYLSADNDTLAVFFDRPFDENTIPNDLSNAFVVNGDGKIGSGSEVGRGVLGNTNYVTIILNNDGTDSSPFLIDSDTLTKTTVGFYDENGQPSSQTSSTVTLESINYVSKVQTGSNVCIKIETEDERSVPVQDIGCSSDESIKSEYHRASAYYRDFDAIGDIVVDNVTLLEWELENNSTKMTFTQAQSYCEDLELDNKANWRVPSMKELESIVDRSESQLMFKNTFSGWGDNYWSSDKFAIEDTSESAWYMNFEDLVNGIDLQSEKFYVRCVRTIKE